MSPNDAPANPSAVGSDGGRLSKITAAFSSLPERSLDICFLAALLLTVFYFLQWPVVAFDTDLWTHLNGGRYLIEHGKLPETSFYSFIDPQRKIVSYSWLFKGLVYEIFRFLGYRGLIIFRTLAGAATLTVIYFMLRKPGAGIGAAAIFTLIFLLFVDSAEGIRPYNFSYLFIAVFLYVLEHRPRKAYLLPPLAVVWINFDGIEYPVMILIVGCYLADYFFKRRRSQEPKERQNLRLLISLSLCLAAVFVSPYGAGLLRVPFTDTAYASSYISELRKFGFDDLLRFRLLGLAPDFNTVSSLLIFSVSAVVLLQLLRQKIPLHHLVLFAGGCYLLTRGARFIHEFVLLSLPCLTAVENQPDRRRRPGPNLLPVGATAALLAVCVAYMHNLYAGRPNYPVTRAGLPVGVTAFLHHVGARGRILNDPVTGGYLGWRAESPEGLPHRGR